MDLKRNEQMKSTQQETKTFFRVLLLLLLPFDIRICGCSDFVAYAYILFLNFGKIVFFLRYFH